MSAWPQAVWIVRKLKLELQLEDKLDDYVLSVIRLNQRINAVEEQYEILEQQVQRFVPTVRATSTEAVTNPSKGTICFIYTATTP